MAAVIVAVRAPMSTLTESVRTCFGVPSTRSDDGAPVPDGTADLPETWLAGRLELERVVRLLLPATRVVPLRLRERVDLPLGGMIRA